MRPLIAIITLCLAACSGRNGTDQEPAQPPAHTFVLVSGSWHGAWCWDKLQRELTALGQKTIAVELPAHGTDSTPIAEVTLDSYVRAVCDSIGRAGGNVVLVGHSRGGIAISQSAEACPERIERLVYLAAFLIPDSQAMIQTAMADTGSLLVRNLVLDTVAGWHLPDPAIATEAFYHDCDSAEASAAAARFTREPNAPVGTPLRLTPQRWGAIPRTYIKTLQDRALTPAMQDRMLTALPCDTVYTMATSHSPFLSRPKELADLLVRIAGD